MPAESTRTWHCTKQPKHVAGNRVNSYALGQFAFDIGNERESRLFGRRELRGRAKDLRIDVEQSPWLLIGSPSHHHAIERAKFCLRLFQRDDSAIQDYVEIVMCGFQPTHESIVK